MALSSGTCIGQYGSKAACCSVKPFEVHPQGTVVDYDRPIKTSGLAAVERMLVFALRCASPSSLFASLNEQAKKTVKSDDERSDKHS